MKSILLLILIFGFYVFANSQNETKTTKLTGVVFDLTGAIIINAKVSAFDKDGKVYQSKSDSDGRYELILPPGKYDIQFQLDGFKAKKYQNFQLVDSTYGKIFQDVVLEGENPEPCGYSGADCLKTSLVKSKKSQVSDKIVKRNIDLIPKKKSKSKKRINN